MPKIDRFKKERNIEALEAITSKLSKGKIVATLKAIECFVMCSCIACGILQMLSLKFSDASDFSKTRWLRTRTNTIVSEDTVAYYLRKNIFRLLKDFGDFDIMRIIIDKQDDYLYHSDESA